MQPLTHLRYEGKTTYMSIGVHRATIYESRGRFVSRFRSGSFSYRKSSKSLQAAVDGLETVMRARIRDLDKDGSVQPALLDTLGPHLEKNITTTDAAAMYIRSCEKRGCSERHIDTVKYHLRTFCNTDRGLLSGISVRRVNYFLEKFESPKTRLNFRTTLVALGNFAKKRNWLPWNEQTAFEASDRPIVKTKEHAILKPDSFEKIIRCAAEIEPGLVPWLALGAFAGIRSAERARMDWGCVDFENKVIILGTSITKTSRRRVIFMSPNLIAWLEKFRGFEIAFYPDSTRLYRALKRVLDACGEVMPDNALRASAASYKLMNSMNMAATAIELGHSVQELETVYFNPALRADAEKWFGIFPK